MVQFGAPDSIPSAPPLPAPRPLQRAREAANRLFGYSSRPPSPQEDDQIRRGSRARFASLSATENATAIHKTGLEINTIAINEEGTHALLGGKEIFKTVRVEDGTCAEDLNLRSAIRSNPFQASGQKRQVYSIDIADVAWAKGDCGHYVAAATSSGKVILYDLGHAGLPAAQLHEHFRQVHKVTFNPHRGNLLLSGSQDGTVRLWDVRDVRQASTLRSKHKYSGQSDGVRDVKWSPTDGVDFGFGTDSGWIQRWDMRNLKQAKIKIPAHNTTCNTIDWHPDGKHIVSAGSDKTVKVFDFSVSRRQKASWEIKTPYPVLNARWRPSCESSLPFDSGARQCTQLVTAYDHSHPILHIWDFRRPSLPFREIAPYSTAPTDLLWHSQDLLWTVGREGIFLQSDIQHAAKLVDKRNLQALAVSSRGDLNLVTLKRRQRRLSNQRALAETANGASSQSHSSVFSRSWQDDSLDSTFLISLPGKQPETTKHKTRTQSLNMAPSGQQLAFSTINLDELLLHRRNHAKPVQLAVRGILPGFRDAAATSYLARKLKIDVTQAFSADDFLATFNALMDHNARVIEMAGFYRLAQSWRITDFVVTNHLKARAKYKHHLMLEDKPQIRTPGMRGDLSLVARRIMKDQIKSPSPTPPSMKPVSSIARQLALSDEASSQKTPLARPVSSGKAENRAEPAVLPDPDVAEHLILPPSLSPTVPEDDFEQRLTLDNLDGLRKLQKSPNGFDKADMVRRWSIQPKEPLSLDPVDENGVKIPPKLEKRDSDESFTFMAGSFDSRDPSFPSSHASTGSGPLQMVAERPSRASLSRNFSRGATEALDFGNGRAEPAKLPFYNVDNLPARPEQSQPFPTQPLTNAVKEEIDAKAKAIGLPTQRDIDESEFGPGSYPDEWGIYPSQAPAPTNFQETAVLKHPPALVTSPPRNKSHKARDSSVMRSVTDVKHPNEGKDTWLYLPEDGDVDLEEDKPIILIDMFRELVQNYASKGDAQTAASLILLLSPLLPRTHPLPHSEIRASVTEYVDCFTSLGYVPEEIEAILDKHIESLVSAGLHPLQNETILSTYHEQLVRLQLYNEAAILRKLAYPAYPAVYEQALKDNSVHIRCSNCKKPLPFGEDISRCENCSEKLANCPICWCNESPYEKEPSASKLWSMCLLCNHGGHAACMNAWFNESGEDDGGCPTEGCLCDCAPGNWRAEKAKMAEKKRLYKNHGRIKSDDWAASESKAVERTREVLGLGVSKGGDQG